MTLEEFIEELREDVNRFYRTWQQAQRGENAEYYPNEMPPGDWEQQWLAFNDGGDE